MRVLPGLDRVAACPPIAIRVRLRSGAGDKAPDFTCDRSQARHRHRFGAVESGSSRRERRSIETRGPWQEEQKVRCKSPGMTAGIPAVSRNRDPDDHTWNAAAARDFLLESLRGHSGATGSVTWRLYVTDGVAASSNLRTSARGDHDLRETGRCRRKNDQLRVNHLTCGKRR